MSATFVGMPAFPVAARSALADSQLRSNLGHATSTIRSKRAQVVAEVDAWEQLRVAGAAIKDNTLLHLDEHLLLLEESLTARGATVHWARDAAEACAVVADVARSHGADEVVKVKSMATQEIGRSTRRWRRRASRRGRQISRSSSCSSATTSRRTSWCPRSTATVPRSATSSCAGWAVWAGLLPTG
jgi:hypothetical protein